MTAAVTTFFLVRHGETVWHGENRYAGVSDVALTDLGERQAQELGCWAGGARLDAVWSSPLTRARRTAEPAARAAGLSVRTDDGLVELDFGAAEGHTMAEVEARDPRAAAAFNEDPAAHPLPGGEDPLQAAARGVAALRRIAAAQPGDGVSPARAKPGAGGRVLVVWHGTLMRLVLCRLLGIPEGEYRRVLPQVRNTALCELSLAGERAGLITYNVPLVPNPR